MLALLSRFVRWSRLDGVHALSRVDVYASWGGHPWSWRGDIPNGRLVEVEHGMIYVDGRWRYWRRGASGNAWMLQSANAEKSQPVSTPEESANK